MKYYRPTRFDIKEDSWINQVTPTQARCVALRFTSQVAQCNQRPFTIYHLPFSDNQWQRRPLSRDPQRPIEIPSDRSPSFLIAGEVNLNLLKLNKCIQELKIAKNNAMLWGMIFNSESSRVIASKEDGREARSVVCGRCLGVGLGSLR